MTTAPRYWGPGQEGDKTCCEWKDLYFERCRSYLWRRGWGRPEREPKDGSADRRLVICKKFISTFKKRTQEVWLP